MMIKTVVLEGCLGDWSQKSYLESLAERARNDEIILYAVDTRDIQGDEAKSEFYETPVKFINKKADRDRYDEITDVNLVFIVTPPDSHCKIAEHWLQEGKLKKDGKLFVEKPLDSSEKRIGNLKKKYKVKDKIIVIDHYILKILPLIQKLKEKKEKCGKIKNMEFNILESEPILESRKKTLDEGLILDIYPHVLAVFIKVMEICNKFALDASSVDILKIKSGKYKSAPITGETFAKIVVKIDETILKSCIGKAVGACDSKLLEISFERGSVMVDFISGNFSIKIEGKNDIDDYLQTSPISMLLDDIIDKELYKKENLNKALNFNDGFEIVKIISKIRKNASKPVKYEKNSSLDDILMKFKKG